MTAFLDDFDDPQGVFAAARGAEFDTPLSHWALSWPEARHLPEFARSSVDSLTRGALQRRIHLSSGFSFAPRLTWRTTSTKEERAQRQRWIDLGLPPPLDWLQLLHGFAEPKALRVHVATKSSMTFVLLLTRDGDPLAYATRTADLAGAHIEHDFFVVARGSKGKGVGAQVIANALAFYPSIGIREVGLMAGLTAGGAVWPKFGFRPTDAREWAKVRAVIKKNATQLPPAVWHAYPGGGAAVLDQALSAILRDDEPDAIWLLSKLDHQRIAARAGNLPHSVGGALLQGCRWKGILELNDPRAIKMARAYIQTQIDAGDVIQPPNW